MIRQDVIDLIAEDPRARGIFEPVAETKRTVFCAVRSVGMNEFYRAMEQDLHPEYVFTLEHFDEYQDEKVCEYHGKRYRIIRTYVDRQRIELTVEEATVDRTHIEPEEVEENGSASGTTE